MTTNDPGGSVRIGGHAVAFLDLLSQKNRIAKIREMPKNNDEFNVFITSLKESYGEVDLFRKGMIRAIEMTEKLVPAAAISSDLHFSAAWRVAEAIKIRHRFFSDCLVLWVPLDETQGDLPVAAVMRMMQSMVFVLTTALSTGHVCRGGLDVGIGGEFFDNEVYGPAVVNAYELESRIAKYPRIAVGKTMMEYLTIQRQDHSDPRPHVTRLRNHFSQICANLIAQDHDGQLMLDYYGRQAAETLSGDSNGGFAKSLEFASAQLARFTLDGNADLIDKYQRLCHYIKSRQSFWRG